MMGRDRCRIRGSGGDSDMARRKKGRSIHGWLVLDKPVGMTSTQAVGAVRRLFDARKAGHAGTLDPLATGVLPIALGEATKTVPYAVDGTKHYRFTVRWGAEPTPTMPRAGSSRPATCARPREAIEALLPRFTGEILQTPPAFSAIKVDGDRAYDLARERRGRWCWSRAPCRSNRWTLRRHAGRRHGRASRPTAARAPTCARSPATWAVRSAASAMSSRCAAPRVAPFDEAQAVTVEALEAAAEQGEEALQRLLLPIEAALQDLADAQRRPERCRAPAAGPGRADPRPRRADRRRRRPMQPARAT